MHVLLEGVVQLELSLLLQYLINSQCFSVDLLNERIDCFHYTPNEKKNKPSAIRLSGSFHQSGRCSLTKVCNVYTFASMYKLCMCEDWFAIRR